MVKYKLEVESDFDFLLFGICAHIKDYKLAWLINQQLELMLVRSENDVINWTSLPNKRRSYGLFKYFNENNGVNYYLINNSVDNVKLLPDQRQFDFFLMIKGDVELSIVNLVKKIREITGVLTVYELDPENIKHKDNLIFDE
ncbi:MAG: hypothetical protein ACJAUV_000850 [Flavobacteriales bacterium]|jgi:hypothetical protein